MGTNSRSQREADLYAAEQIARSLKLYTLAGMVGMLDHGGDPRKIPGSEHADDLLTEVETTGVPDLVKRVLRGVLKERIDAGE